jgi:hypothetical protein
LTSEKTTTLYYSIHRTLKFRKIFKYLKKRRSKLAKKNTQSSTTPSHQLHQIQDSGMSRDPPEQLKSQEHHMDTTDEGEP